MATNVSQISRAGPNSNGVYFNAELYFTYNINWSNERIEITNLYMSAWKELATIPSPASGAGNWTWHAWRKQGNQTYGDYTYRAQVLNSEVPLYTSSNTTNKCSFNIPFADIDWGGTSFTFNVAGALNAPSGSIWHDQAKRVEIAVNCPITQTYTISYNANGGSGAPSNQTKYYNKNITLSSTKPTKSGSRFEGWSTSSSATTANYQPGQTYSTNANLTLYAVWTPTGSYDCYIVYKCGGGQITDSNSTYNLSSSGSGDIQKDNYTFWPGTVSYNNNYSLLSTSTFSLLRTGYTIKNEYYCEQQPSLKFNGGTSYSYTSLEPGMLTRQYSNSSNYYRIIYLVVNWTPITYTISYNLNGGNFPNGYNYIQNNRLANPSGNVTYDLSSFSGVNNEWFELEIPTKTGYKFKGWNFTGLDYLAAQLWYKANNSSNYEWHNLPDSTGNFSTVNIDNKRLFAQHLRTSSGTVNITAIWEPETYSIAYDLDGGTAPSRGYNKKVNSGSWTFFYNPLGQINYDLSNYTANSGYSHNDYFHLDSPSKTGYNFLGWLIEGMDNTTHDFWYNNQSNSTTAFSFNTSTISEINAPARHLRATNGEVLYTALWQAKTTTITLDKNNGSGGTSSITATYDEAMPSITLPSRTNYTFLGYYTSSSAGTQYYTSTGASAKDWDKIDSTYTLYAHWRSNSSGVYLDQQGGSGGTENITATQGSAMPSITIPTRVGYQFLGYFDAISGGTQYYDFIGASAKNWDKTGAQTLYAHWEFRGIYVFHNGNWKKVAPHVYSSTYSTWKECSPFVFYNSAWQPINPTSFIKITSQPTSSGYLGQGSSTTRTVTAVSSRLNLSYQWQCSTSGSGTFNPITSANPFGSSYGITVSDYKTKKITIAASANASKRNYYFKCQITDGITTIYSNVITVIVIAGNTA